MMHATIQEPSAGVPPAMSPQDLAELIAAFTDVTRKLERTHAEMRAEVARLNAELRAANVQLRRSRRLAALGEMAAGIAHEIRNPLGSIRLYARLLRQDLSGRAAEQDLARKIDDAVVALDGIVGDVLRFAREQEPRLDDHDADELLARAAAASAPPDELERSGVRLEHRPSPGTMLRCDGALVVQAIGNIIRNALQAMSESGEGSRARVLRLGVEAARARGPRGESREAVEFTIADTGPGVSPEVIERMFNPFFTTRAQGTGLGLAIVHRIVDAHGGRVEVRSPIPGGGTLVRITLPRRPLGAAQESDA